MGRISADSQLLVPPEVLAALGLSAGDPVLFVVQDGMIVLGRVDDPFINPTATFTEWASEADCRAYDNL